MKTKFFMAPLLLCALTMVLTACPGPREDLDYDVSLLYGTWEMVSKQETQNMKVDESRIAFYENGDYYMLNLVTQEKVKGTFRLEGSKLYVTVQGESDYFTVKKLTAAELTLQFAGEAIAYFEKVKGSIDDNSGSGTGSDPDPAPNPDDDPTLSKFDSQFEGALKGWFTIGELKSCKFSQGNLTYLPAENRFRFHENQYDMCPMIHNVYTTDKATTWQYWIDLFFWGTSGWSGGVYDYRPGTRNNNNTFFYINNDMTQDMDGDYAYADWGRYNTIENGDKTHEIWSTLSVDEVRYLFQKRDKATELFGLGYVGSFNGLFLMPDDYVQLKNIHIKSFKETNGNCDPELNRFTYAEFSTLEKHGVVFLPGAGRANYLGGTSFSPTPGWYWTSSTADEKPEYVWMLYFDEGKVGLHEGERNYGRSVRLVIKSVG